MCLPLPHSRKLCLFFLLSATDLLLTWWLLQSRDGQVYEGNPLASWWLARYGWVGLTAFKTAAVLLVVGICALISFSRPHLAGLVLTFACAALMVVVAYSSSLAGCVKAECRCPMADTVQRNQETTLRIDDELRRCHEYGELVKRLSVDVKAQQRTLSEAVTELASLEKATTSPRLRALRAYYPDCSDEECLAASLREHLAADSEASVP